MTTVHQILQQEIEESRTWLDREKDESTYKILRELNLGISAVTPCYLLKEILFSPSEVEYRKKFKN